MYHCDARFLPAPCRAARDLDHASFQGSQKSAGVALEFDHERSQHAKTTFFVMAF